MDDRENETVKITKKRLSILLRNEELLMRYEEAGVDNWYDSPEDDGIRLHDAYEMINQTVMDYPPDTIFTE